GGDRVGGDPAWRVPAPRRRGGGAPRLPPVALQVDRELQRAVQGDLRRPRPGADQGIAGDHTPRARCRVRLSAHVAASLRARSRPPRRPQALPQGRLITPLAKIMTRPHVRYEWTPRVQVSRYALICSGSRLSPESSSLIPRWSILGWKFDL